MNIAYWKDSIRILRNSRKWKMQLQYFLTYWNPAECILLKETNSSRVPEHVQLNIYESKRSQFGQGCTMLKEETDLSISE